MPRHLPLFRIRVRHFVSTAALQPLQEPEQQAEPIPLPPDYQLIQQQEQLI